MPDIKDIVEKAKRTGRFDESGAMDQFFAKIIWPRVVSSPRIDFTTEDFESINEWAVKSWEPAVRHKYPNDAGSAIKRGITYGLSETAIERYWGLPEGSIFDRTIGKTADFDEPDLAKIGIPHVGIKASEAGLVPLVSRNRCYYQIFCIHTIDRTNWFKPKASTYVCGMADTKTIMNNMDPCLTATKTCTKSGFYGFDKLIPVPTDYKTLVKEV